MDRRSYSARIHVHTHDNDRYGSLAHGRDLSYDDINDSATDTYAGDELSDDDRHRERRSTVNASRVRREPGWCRNESESNEVPRRAGRRAEAASDIYESERRQVTRMREAERRRDREEQEMREARTSRHEQERRHVDARSSCRVILVDSMSDEESETGHCARRRRNVKRCPRGADSGLRYDSRNRRDPGHESQFRRRIIIDSDDEEESDVPYRPARRS